MPKATCQFRGYTSLLPIKNDLARTYEFLIIWPLSKKFGHPFSRYAYLVSLFSFLYVLRSRTVYKYVSMLGCNEFRPS